MLQDDRRSYLTTALPYVNARPHLGFAMELVVADALARHRRRRGERVRLLSGTDDNSLKNVLAAEAAGLATAELVARHAADFRAIHAPLDVAVDDFIQTGSDPRHRPGVERLWRACSDAGDLYRRAYEGLYCTGCEQFWGPSELVDGNCPEHGTAPDRVAEENWFFRLSRYQARLEDLLTSGRLRVLPEHHHQEVLAFVRAGLRDFSISRSRARARGWGIPVPGDPDQVVYVWWDALGNYVTALGYGDSSEGYRRWWLDADERVHVIGKGILRFHAVYWPAMLLSAGEPPPTTILVHQYLTRAGRKLSKSLGNTVEVAPLTARVGTDALRWWLLREPGPGDDVDFDEARVVARANDELANGVGNLVSRTVAMVHRYRQGRVPGGGAGPLAQAVDGLPSAVDAALAAFDLRAATGTIVALVGSANRLVNSSRPWELARSGHPEELDAVLAALVTAGRAVAGELEPFTPGLAGRVRVQLAGDVLPPPAPVFPRLRPAHGGNDQRPQQARAATARPGSPQSGSGSPSKTGPAGSTLMASASAAVARRRWSPRSS
jgi:methionyl-tRNA synthetase